MTGSLWPQPLNREWSVQEAALGYGECTSIDEVRYLVIWVLYLCVLYFPGCETTQQQAIAGCGDSDVFSSPGHEGHPAW